MFEIRYRDAMGRIGKLEARGKVVETPIVLPVINPRIQKVPLKEIKRMGFPGIITNSYIIKKDPALRKAALDKGIHKLLDFDGLVMTDSGSFQLYRYGKVEAEPKEIVEFQRDIGSDIGVILDIPSPPDADKEKARKDLLQTIERGRASIEIPKNGMLLSGTVQGGIYPDLREEGAKRMGEMGFDLYPIGGVVPLMEDYRFPELVRVVMHSKKFLPLDKPVHLFGCGHPMIFALAVAMGCDVFDSAAYSLYARDDRYITAEETFRLQELLEFPCSCEVCSDSNPREMQGLKKEERELLLAKHNLYASLTELKRVKQSIYHGSLWELVENRARNHPYLLEGLRVMLGYDFIGKFGPVTKKSAFFYSGPESLQRPEVKRHLERLKEIELRGDKLLLLPEAERPYSKTYGTNSTSEYHICVASPIFGVIPLEVEDVYPLGQHEGPRTVEKAQKEFMESTLEKYSKAFEEVYFYGELGIKMGEELDAIPKVEEEEASRIKVRAIADYQFGRGAGKLLFHDAKVERARTGRIRRITSKKTLLTTLRASDGILIPTLQGAERLLKMPYPKNRVVVSDDAVEFVKEGKSVFAKFVKDCDQNIRPYQEVIVVDKGDRLLATGTAILNGGEMLAFERGVAVKIRHRAKS